MTAFDATFSVIESSLGSPSEEALAEGANPVVEVAFTIGVALPFAGPDGQQIATPYAIHRYPFNREQAIALFQKGLEAAEALPEEKKSDILVTSNMSAVEQAAQQLSKVRGS